MYKCFIFQLLIGFNLVSMNSTENRQRLSESFMPLSPIITFVIEEKDKHINFTGEFFVDDDLPKLRRIDRFYIPRKSNIKTKSKL